MCIKDASLIKLTIKIWVIPSHLGPLYMHIFPKNKWMTLPPNPTPNPPISLTLPLILNPKLE